MSGLDSGMQNGATECNLCFVCSPQPVFCLSLDSLTLLPQPSFTPFAITLLTFSCRTAATSKKKKAKIKRRLLDYSPTCVPFVWSCRRGGNKTPGTFWQTLARHGARCTGAPRLQYHVWTGMNIWIACFIFNPHIFWGTRLFTAKFPSVVSNGLPKHRHHKLKMVPIKKNLKKELQMSYSPEISDSFICEDGMKLSS